MRNTAEYIRIPEWENEIPYGIRIEHQPGITNIKYIPFDYVSKITARIPYDEVRIAEECRRQYQCDRQNGIYDALMFVLGYFRLNAFFHRN